MARLPAVGGDVGNWGSILNGFLSVSLNSDGSIAASAMTTAGAVTSVNTIAPGSNGNLTLSAANVSAVPSSSVGAASGVASLNSSGLVPSAQLGTGTASSSNYLRGDGTWVTPSGGSSTLASDSDVAIVSPSTGQVLTYNSGASKWENESPAVASVFGRTGAVVATTGDYTAAQVTGALVNTNNLSDVSSAASARTNLGLGTAATQNSTVFLQAANNLSDVASESTAFSNIKQNATTGATGVIQLAGDLGNTATSPKVESIQGVAISGTPSANQILTASSSTAAAWSAPASAPVSSVFGRTGAVVAQSGDYTAAQVGALPSTDDLSAIASANPTAANWSNNSKAITGVSDLAVSGLTGATAASRYVGATVSGAPASGTFAVGDFVIDQTGLVWVCTTAGTSGTWTKASLTIDSTAGDIQPLGAQTAGSTGKAADAGHIHPATGVALLAGTSFTGQVSVNANTQLGSGTAAFAGGAGVVGLANAGTAASGAVSNGLVLFSMAGLLQILNSAGLLLTVQGAQPAVTTPVSLTTTNITSLGSMTVPANDPVVGAVYRLTCFGYFSTTSTAVTVTIGLTWGGTGGTSLGSMTVTPTASLTNDFWQAEGLVTFVTSTTCVAQLLFTLNTAGSVGYAGATHVVGTTAAVTVTTSSSEALSINGTSSSTTNLSTFTCLSSVAERVA